MQLRKQKQGRCKWNLKDPCQSFPMDCCNVRPLSIELLFIFRKPKCSIIRIVCQSAINHQKIFQMFVTKMLENFLWKSPAIVKLQVYISSSLKHQQFTDIFEYFILGLKRHEIYFAENLWATPTDWLDDMLKRNEMLWSLTWLSRHLPSQS